jgi:zona occludens toxin
MVFVLTGVPGSGKSYYLVQYAEKELNKIDPITKEKKYKGVLHNISGYKHGYYQDFGDFGLRRIMELYDYFLTIKKEKEKDEMLIKKSEELSLYKMLLIVDECHLYYVNDVTEEGKKRYYALLWFMSYHRHIYCDLVLATQNLSLIDTKFKAFAEYYVVAVSQSLRLGKSFKYNHYPSSRLIKKEKYKTEKMKPKKEIFELYTSGDSVKVTSAFKSIFNLIGFFIALLLLAYYFLMPDKPKKEVKIKKNKPTTEIISDINKTLTRTKKPTYKPTTREKEKEIFKSVVYDVVTCSDLSGTCGSKLTKNLIHIEIFNRLQTQKAFFIFKEEYQHGLTKKFILLNITKSQYLEAYLIKLENEEFREDQQPTFTPPSFGDVSEVVEKEVRK